MARHPFLDRSDLAAAQAELESSCHCSRAYTAKLSEYLEEFGSHGPAISGAGRDHFPEAAKDHLRRIARAVTHHSDLAREARPYRVRATTINRLAREVATRDGSGFYGPQPLAQGT